MSVEGMDITKIYSQIRLLRPEEPL